MGSRKIAPEEKKRISLDPNSNIKPKKPNPNPDRGAIFLGGNFRDTEIMKSDFK